MNTLPASHSLSFFEWRGKRVMTLAMADELYGLERGRAASIFCAHKGEFVTGRDAYFIRGTQAYDELPAGITSYWTNNLWLITISGYQILNQIIRNSPSRKKIKPL